jgi:multidrug efflux pump subunit AcrA (membrane-fusion protein)
VGWQSVRIQWLWEIEFVRSAPRSAFDVFDDFIFRGNLMKRFIRQLVVICWAVVGSGGFLTAFAQPISQSPEIEQTGEPAVALIAVQVADEVGDPVDELPVIVTVTAEQKPVIAYESFAGVFESTRAHEVSTQFEVWTDLVIDSAVTEGTAVTKGQPLLKFDSRSIDKAIAEAEFAVRNAEFDLQKAQLQAKQINEMFELDMAIADREWKNSQEDYDYFQKTELPQELKDLEYGEKTARYGLEYSTDELDQLQQMYTEDDLTEESEEIVLKRARRSVESAERSLERALARYQRQRETELPREQVQREESLRRSELAHARSLITLPIEKQKSGIALAQAEFDLKGKQQKLTELKSDQAQMILTAPVDGVVYYGSCERGKWTAPAGVGERGFESKKKLAANAVIMTIVDLNQLMIRAEISESSLALLAPRDRGKCLVAAAGNAIIPVMIKSISRIPITEGRFDCQIMIDNVPAGETLMPGMGCKLSFLVHENKSAIVVSKDSVFSDDDDVTHFVYLIKDGTPVRTEVRVGVTSGEDIEILKGISAGDEIAKDRP